MGENNAITVPKGYEMGCFVCGYTDLLRMHPHRNNDGYICGYIFICVDCAPLIEGKQYIIHMAPVPPEEEHGSFKIQVFNRDIHNDWQDYEAAGTFETEEEAQCELDRLFGTWTSMFKRGRVVPIHAGGDE